MKIKCFIELPRDEYGNRGYTNSQAQVIMAEVKTREGKPGTYGSVPALHIIKPNEFKVKWSVVLQQDMSGDYWIEVDHKPGNITEQKYVELLQSASNVPTWMIEAAQRRSK